MKFEILATSIIDKQNEFVGFSSNLPIDRYRKSLSPLEHSGFSNQLTKMVIGTSSQILF
jgi:hypothetical protein